MPIIRNGSKEGFEPGLTLLRVQRSTTELPRSTISTAFGDISWVTCWCATDNREATVRIPLALHGNFGNFPYPTLAVSFGTDTKSRWSLLAGVYARGSKIPHTGGKCLTCR